MITIHCAWCNSVQQRITKVEWQNLEGKITKNGLVGEPLRLYAETKGIVGDLNATQNHLEVPYLSNLFQQAHILRFLHLAAMHF